jgi:CHASE3 domain sensor protein
MGTSSYRNLQTFKERVTSADRIVQLLGVSMELFTELQDAESGKRGYLLTGKESYLAPYQSALKRVDPILTRLIPVANVIPNGSQRLEQLKTLSDDKLREMQNAIDLYRSKGLPAALEVDENDAAQHHMAQNRAE